MAPALESTLQNTLIASAAGLKAAYLLRKQHAKLTLSASAFTMTQNRRTSFYWQRLALLAGRIPAEDHATSTTDPWHGLVPPHTHAHTHTHALHALHAFHAHIAQIACNVLHCTHEWMACTCACVRVRSAHGMFAWHMCGRAGKQACVAIAQGCVVCVHARRVCVCACVCA